MMGSLSVKALRDYLELLEEDTCLPNITNLFKNLVDYFFFESYWNRVPRCHLDEADAGNPEAPRG